jgi:hypothetical protein
MVFGNLVYFYLFVCLHQENLATLDATPKLRVNFLGVKFHISGRTFFSSCLLCSWIKKEKKTIKNKQSTLKLMLGNTKSWHTLRFSIFFTQDIWANLTCHDLKLTHGVAWVWHGRGMGVPWAWHGCNMWV